MRFFGNQSGSAHLRREMEIKEFCVACGNFIGLGDMDRNEWERPGTALVPPGIPYAEGIFAVRARGHSMEPRIRNRMWCLFHPEVVGTRQDRIVLAEDRGKIGGDRYTLNKYRSRKAFSQDRTWKHTEILLLPVESRTRAHSVGRGRRISGLRLVRGRSFKNPTC
jgi:hypothetical protein